MLHKIEHKYWSSSCEEISTRWKHQHQWKHLRWCLRGLCIPKPPWFPSPITSISTKLLLLALGIRTSKLHQGSLFHLKLIMELSMTDILYDSERCGAMRSELLRQKMYIYYYAVLYTLQNWMEIPINCQILLILCVRQWAHWPNQLHETISLRFCNQVHCNWHWFVFRTPHVKATEAHSCLNVWGSKETNTLVTMQLVVPVCKLPYKSNLQYSKSLYILTC